MHEGIALSAAVETIPDGSSLMAGGFMGIRSPHRSIGELVRQGRMSARFDHALRMVGTYLAECAHRKDWGDPRTAELTEVIRSCVECINNRRDHKEGSDTCAPREALRYALGYVDEHSYTIASDDWFDGRPAW